MARPRRAAQPLPRRAWPVALGVAVVVALVGLVLAPRLREDTATGPTPGPVSSSSTTSRPSPTPAPTPSLDPDAVRVLHACRKKVAAGDEVLAAARTGMQHWTQHVKAQLDADAGEISVAEMNAIFRRTQLPGPEDVRKYNRAVRALDRTRGSCVKGAGATGKVAKRFAACAERRQAQLPVLAAAADGMSDWEQHLRDTRDADQGKILDPAERWRRAYAAAPTRITAYERAVKDFDAPRC